MTYSVRVAKCGWESQILFVWPSNSKQADHPTSPVF